MYLRDIDFVPEYPPAGTSDDLTCEWLKQRGHAIAIEANLYLQLKETKVKTPGFTKVHCIGVKSRSAFATTHHKPVLNVQTVHCLFDMAQYIACNCDIEKSRLISVAIGQGLLDVAKHHNLDATVFQKMMEKCHREQYCTHIQVKRSFVSPAKIHKVQLDCKFFLNRCDVTASLLDRRGNILGACYAGSYQSADIQIVKLLQSASWNTPQEFSWNGAGLEAPFTLQLSDFVDDSLSGSK